MASFTKLQLAPQPKLQHNTAESRYWSTFTLTQPCPVKHISAIRCIEFNPTDANQLAFCSSTRVVFYNYSNGSLQQTAQISRFKQPVHSIAYRPDGKLLCCGIDTGDIQLYDINSRNMLRQCRGHTAAVHSTVFNKHDTAYLYSGSDDSTVKYWNIQTEQCVTTYTAQRDYIRSIVQHPTMPSVVYAGAYDGTVAMYDTRVGTEAQQLVQHKSPVEAMLCMPGGTLLLAAGENYINIYDVLNNGHRIQTLSNHTKTITSLCLDGSHTRLLSAGLDQHIKVYDTTSYNVTHTYAYKQPILSMQLNSTNTLLSLGTISGELLVSHRTGNKPAQPKQHHPLAIMRGNTKRYFNRGANSQPADTDIVVSKHRKQKFTEYDNYLRKFQYHAALNSALATQRVSLIYSVLNELIDRNGLIIALSNRDETTLAPILEYIVQNIHNPLYTTLLIDIANIVLDIYTAALGQSPAIDQLVATLKQVVQSQTDLFKAMYKVQGQLDVYLSNSNTVAQSTIELLEQSAEQTQALQLETEMLFDQHDNTLHAEETKQQSDDASSDESSDSDHEPVVSPQLKPKSPPVKPTASPQLKAQSPQQKSKSPPIKPVNSKANKQKRSKR